MDGVQVLLLAFDDAWGHAYESLQSATLDLGDAEATHQPPAWAADPPDPGVGVPGTILWHLNHLEHCHRHYTAILRARPVTEQPDTPAPGPRALGETLVALEASTAALRREIAILAPRDLQSPCTGPSDVASFVAMLTRHVTWHASQIRSLRRLAGRR